MKATCGLADKPVAPDYWAVKGWENTMLKLNYKADIVFFGNSITYYGDFQKAFPNKKVVNLGYPGDNIDNMMRRIEGLKGLRPDKVFLMAGINGLKNMGTDVFARKYSVLVDSIKKTLPEAQVYLQSILPISHIKEKDYGENTKIIKANRIIKNISSKKNCMYVDLHSLYIKNGEMPLYMTADDGIHIKPTSYKPWYEKIRKYVYK